jgi:IS1 family transposase
LDRDTEPLLDWACGRRDKQTLQKMVDRLTQGDVQVYCADQWRTYASVIPPGTLVQSKTTTHDIERNHCRQRHWFGRFKRKSIIVSTSQEMVDLTMALFAQCWVNGKQDELLSLLT